MHFRQELANEEPDALERLRAMLCRQEAPVLPGPAELERLRARMGGESPGRAPLPPPTAPTPPELIRHDV